MERNHNDRFYSTQPEPMAVSERAKHADKLKDCLAMQPENSIAEPFK
jgi:hypothetical protein